MLLTSTRSPSGVMMRMSVTEVTSHVNLKGVEGVVGVVCDVYEVPTERAPLVRLDVLKCCGDEHLGSPF